MQTSFFIVAIQVALIATSMLAQSVGTGPKVVLKEIHFRGELGLPVSELRDYTEYLIGHPMDQAKMLEAAQSAVGMGLRHRGYWKAQVTPQIQLLQRSVNSKNKEVALEVAIKAGRQYRVKDISFRGLSTELPQTELRQAFNIQRGDIADANEIGFGMQKLQSLFKRKGKDIYVVPSMTYDDPASTVSLQFDVEK